MYKLTQHMKDIDQSYMGLIKLDPFSVSIDTELIDRDIKKLNEQVHKTKNRTNAENLRIIIKNLKTLKNKVEDGTIEICYSVKDNRLITYPIELTSYPEYNINMADYLNLHNEKLIMVDTTDIMNIMAFDYIFKDFGYSHDDIEEVLAESGITGTVEVKSITEWFKSENLNPYEIGKSAKIEESPYLNYNKKLKDYFGTKDEKPIDGKYNSILAENAKTINSLIANDIVKSREEELRIIMIGETSFAILVQNNADIKLDKLITDISIRFFGRNFKVAPKVNIL